MLQGKTVQHKSTGTLLLITKIAAKTIYMQVTEVGTYFKNNFYIGMENKTSFPCLEAFYTIL